MLDTRLSRRSLVRGSALTAGALLVPGALSDRSDDADPLRIRPSRPAAPTREPDDALLAQAKAALDAHAGTITRRDRIAVVDFDAGSAKPRMRLVDLEGGRVEPLLVSHGSGSDPGHTGYLQRFSNVEGSEATSKGAYLTSNYYVGKHGRSQRLIGLDPTNDQAMARAIVLHGAWYAEPTMVAEHGKLGRSQGCFAVGDSCLATLFDHLGEGRMLYAAKV